MINNLLLFEYLIGEISTNISKNNEEKLIKSIKNFIDNFNNFESYANYFIADKSIHSRSSYLHDLANAYSAIYDYAATDYDTQAGLITSVINCYIRLFIKAKRRTLKSTILYNVYRFIRKTYCSKINWINRPKESKEFLQLGSHFINTYSSFISVYDIPDSIKKGYNKYYRLMTDAVQLYLLKHLLFFLDYQDKKLCTIREYNELKNEFLLLSEHLHKIDFSDIKKIFYVVFERVNSYIPKDYDYEQDFDLYDIWAYKTINNKFTVYSKKQELVRQERREIDRIMGF